MSDSFDSTLESLPKDYLIALIKLMLYEKPELHKTVLEWIKEKEIISDKFQVLEINDTLFKQYWNEAHKIISDFNDYGGGPDEEEDEIVSLLEKLVDFVDKNPITQNIKFEFIDECFSEYHRRNSGLDDLLIDTIYDVCDSEEDWFYVIENLRMYPTEWNLQKIENIRNKYLS